MDRARAVQPAFALTPQNVDAIIQICRRLDGIPLAIELAAARVKALPPEQIAARLDDRFRLLTGGSRMALPRHRTLKAALDWSFDLLTDAERALLVRLSVFAGGFGLDAVEAVCTGGVVEQYDVLDLLTRLIDRSLVVVEPAEEEARYRLLDSVQQYAVELLVAEGQEADIRGRHQAFIVELVERPDAPAVPGRRAGLRRAIPSACRRAGKRPSCPPVGGRRSRRGGDRAPADRQPGSLLGDRGVPGGGSGLAGAGPGPDRWRSLRGPRATRSPLSPPWPRRRVTSPRPIAALEEALATQRQLDNPNAVAYAAGNLANVQVERGDLDGARAHYEESLALLEGGHDPRAAAITKLNLADVADRQGDRDEARRLADESVETFRMERDPIGIAMSQGRSATFSLRRGDRDDARRRHEEALEIFRMFGDVRGVARTQMFIGDIAALDGDLDEAERLYRESIDQRWSLGDRSGLATACDRLARLALVSDPERAARLLGFADAQRDSIGASLPSVDAAEREELLQSLEGRLGSAALADLRHAGRRLPLVTVLLSSAPAAEARPAG